MRTLRQDFRLCQIANFLSRFPRPQNVSRDFTDLHITSFAYLENALSLSDPLFSAMLIHEMFIFVWDLVCYSMVRFSSMFTVVKSDTLVWIIDAGILVVDIIIGIMISIVKPRTQSHGHCKMSRTTKNSTESTLQNTTRQNTTGQNAVQIMPLTCHPTKKHLSKCY